MRPAAATVSVTPVPALTVFAVRAPVGESVRRARQVKRVKPTEVVRQSLQAVILTMNVRGRMLHHVVRPACVMAPGLARFIQHPPPV